MAKTFSKMLALGTKAPDFNLLDIISNKNISLSDVKSEVATVIMFICNHCPFVLHIQKKLVEVVKEYQAKGISFVAINSNDVNTYPADSPENMKKHAKQYGFTFPYLFDESQEIAKAYQAACTPDFYVFDKNLACVYRGRFDGATPGNSIPITGEDLKQVLDALLTSKPINENQQPSLGCNIKWKE